MISVDALPDFIKQFFVLAVLFFFISLLIVTLQARAHAFYADPLQQPTATLWKCLLSMECMRIFVIYILLLNEATVGLRSPRALGTYILLHATAPATLIFFTSLIGLVMWPLVFKACHRFGVLGEGRGGE